MIKIINKKIPSNVKALIAIGIRFKFKIADELFSSITGANVNTEFLIVFIFNITDVNIAEIIPCNNFPNKYGFRDSFLFIIASV